MPILQFDASASGSRGIGRFDSLQAVRPDGGQLLGQPLTGTIYLHQATADRLFIVLATDGFPTRRLELYVKHIDEPPSVDAGSPHFTGLFWMDEFYLFGAFVAAGRSD